MFKRKIKMSKKKKNANTTLLIVLFLVAGFFIGQFLHVPAFSQYNLLGASAAPGSGHHREK